MRRLVMTLAVFVTACSDITGSDLPPIAGTYSATFQLTFSNSLETETSSLPGTVTLHSPSGGGEFSGTYVMTGAGSGTIAGTLRSDGGISITQFGDPNADPLESLQILENEFYWCDFNYAAGTPMSGSVAGGTLNLGGAISVPCNYVNPTQTVPSTISVTVTAFR